MLSPDPHPIRRYSLLTILLSFLLTVMIGNATAQASVNIAHAPLSVSVSVNPNIMFIIDDSGSMDSEVLLPTNDGALWWRTGSHQSFVGLDGNNNAASGILNFNRDGNATADWKKYTYLFPNGTGAGNRVYSDSNHDHFAIPPIAPHAYFRSADYNGMYYDPSITYDPWISQGSHTFGNVTPNAAPSDPTKGSATFNLTVDQTDTRNHWRFRTQNGMIIPQGTRYHKDSSWHTASNDMTWTAEENIGIQYYPATYYQKITSGSYSVSNGSSTIAGDCANPDPAHYLIFKNYPSNLSSSSDVDALAYDGGCLKRYEIKEGNTFPSGRSYADEMQNFANWFTYYRKRHSATRAAIGIAFEDLSSLRVGAFTINNRSLQGMWNYDNSTDRASLFNYLYGLGGNSGGTPNREALHYAGQQFDTNTSIIQYRCQKNFALLFTDGYSNVWTGSNVGNADGGMGVPFEDAHSNTIADIAMRYYKQPLRSAAFPQGQVPVPTGCNVANPPAHLNCNRDLHMVTFGITLGAQGHIFGVTHHSIADAHENPPAWQNPTTQRNPVQVDDLYHAAINSRGDFFSASNPQMLTASLSAALTDIIARASSSSSSAAASSAVLQSDTLIYTAGFRSEDWSGTFTARRINADGSVSNVSCAECWDAEVKLAAHNPVSRNIFTRAVGTSSSGSGGGVSLTWSSLHTNQRAALNHTPENTSDSLGEARLNWLRGTRGTEHSSLRSRTETGNKRLLGDIIHSDPQYKNGVLYVGANDGMLHAFDATSGEELFAYIPSELLLPEPGRDHAPLTRLMSPDYTHRYFMDGTPAIAEVTLSGAAKTVLVSSMGAGGRSLFALDVSSPESFSASNVLWEFRDPDLGYRSGTPAVVRMNDGTWAVVTGNGYNSDSGKAFLFVINLATGALIKKIPTNDATANGLATPFVTDWPERNLRAQRIYAGDLLGNLWAFDVSGNANQWDNQNRRRILFTATDAAGNPQPITSRPYGARTSDSEAMIVLGTGSYFRTQDANDNQVQSLYGIVDHASVPNDFTSVARADLLEQKIIAQRVVDGKTLRVVSDYEIGEDDKGWFIDLNKEMGERVIAGPRTLGRKEQRVRFSTIIPDEDPCGTGLRGFLMDIGLLTGGRTETPVFDLDRDGDFDEDDMRTFTTDDGETITVPPSGLELGSGGGAPLVIDVRDETTEDTQLICDGQGNCEIGRPGDDRNPGRQSWQQLR
ncbi:pilus assembly protein [Thiorhodospira sibirica]|uniref:pilus assembly protein n=1 Tax=Thiorhodospira sibirica TaxID=154347 RepID=UPI00022C116C|nr:PilC/PilY family type IV pilus protein [Thiorhodospira sibirica]